MIQFWWRSGSCFGSGSPKSEIRILRIGGGLCSLSIDFLFALYLADVTLQAIRDEEVQYCEAYEGRFGGVEVKADKVKKDEAKKTGI